MHQAKLRIVLRALLLALFASVVVLIGLAVLGDKLLPADLATWSQAEYGGEWKLGDFVSILFWLSGLGLTFIGMAGMFFYQRWAAWLFLVVQIIFSIQIVFSPTVEPGIVSFLSGWADVMTGVIIALAFFTPVLDETESGHGA